MGALLRRMQRRSAARDASSRPATRARVSPATRRAARRGWPGLAACAALALACVSPGPPATPEAEAGDPASSAADGAASGETPASEAEPGAREELPPGLRRAIDREAQPRATQLLRDPEARFEARVPASLVGEIEILEDRTVLRLDAGSGTPVECSLFEREADLASALQQISAALFQRGQVEARQISAVDAGAIEATPFLALAWIYRAQQEGGPAVGMLKQRIARREGRTVYCQHAEVGYVATFARVFRELVDTLDFADAEPSVPYYREIGLVHIGELTVGFTRLEFGRELDGEVRVVRHTSELVPQDPRNVSARDGYVVERATPEGELLEKVVVEAENGQPVSRLRLEVEGEGGRYAVAGLYAGERVEATLQPAEPLLAVPGQYAAVREALEAGEDGVAYRTWMPEFDPARLVRVEAAFETPRAEGPVETTLRLFGTDEEEPLVRMDALLDRRGSTLRTEMPVPVGDATIRMERVHVHGAP